MTESAMQRREVYYSGHVQGVGFRMTAFQIAGKCEVVGTVRNLADGRVHLVAEGTQQELDRFLSEINRRLGRYVEEAEITDADATGQFADFAISG